MDSAIKANLVSKKTAVRKYLDKTYVRKCGVEVKRQLDAITYTLSGTLATLTGTITSGMATGVSDIQRTGNSFELKKWTTKLLFRNPNTAVNTSYVRLFLIKVGRNSGLMPTGSEILLNSTSILSPLVSTADNVVSGNFTILKEINFSLAPYGNAGQDKLISINYYPKGCHEVKFTTGDTLGSSGNIIEGGLALYGMSSGVATPLNTLAASVLEWVDI